MGNFTFICGNDSFLVQEESKQAIAALKAKLPEDTEIEVLEGFCNSVGEAEKLVQGVRDATQTLSLFASEKLIWIKDFSLLGDNRTAKAQGTIDALEALQEILAGLDPQTTACLVSASPVDRRTARFKWFQKHSDCTVIDDKSAQTKIMSTLNAHAKALGIQVPSACLELLLNKVGNSGRMAMEELNKLASYIAKDARPLTEADILAMVPDFGDSDFFEIVEAFFAKNLKWTMEAIDRFFFTNKESRPVLASLQNRNRILIQLKVLLDAGKISIGPQGVSKNSLEAAKSRYAGNSDEKSAYNVFTQNPWYLGRLAESLRHFNLKELIDIQNATIELFRSILKDPDQQPAHLRHFSLQHL